MAEHARSTFRALQAVGVTPRLLDVGEPGAAVDPDLAADFGPHLTQTLGRGVNIFGVNGDEAARVLARLGEDAFRAGGYNIAYPVWELARYPAEWARVLDRFDEVWAPSAFVQQALADAVSRPVYRMPLPVDLKISSFLGRRHFGVPEDAFVVLFFFDLLSFATRKNPGAVLEAFERVAAARPDADILCVIKARSSAGDAVQAELEARVAALGARAMLVTGDLSDNEIKNLVRNSEVFVSLHRSEGFGRGMAEAMAFGRPAIATGYSGNVDFMVPGTSLLVDYDLVPVAPGAYPHGEGQCGPSLPPSTPRR